MSDLSTKRYDYPVYGTQGGGLVRSVGQTYIFVEKPDCPGLDVGDEMPEEWGVIPANYPMRPGSKPTPVIRPSAGSRVLRAPGPRDRREGVCRRRGEG